MAQGIDPIHQFQLHDLAGPWNIAGHEISFTNSALFMGIAVGLITVILLAAAARLREFAAFYGIRSQQLATHLGVSLAP